MSAVSAEARARRHSASVRIPVIGTRVPRRELAVTGALALGIVLLAVVALGTGDYPLSVPEVVSAMFATDGVHYQSAKPSALLRPAGLNDRGGPTVAP